MRIFASKNKKVLSITKKDWLQIGKIAGWQQPEFDFPDEDKIEKIDYEDQLSEYFRKVEEHRLDIMRDWYKQKRKKNKSKMSWNVIPFDRVRKIWTDYARYGIVRDVKGMYKIKEQMLNILARLTASNEIAGHANYSVDEEIEAELGRKMPDGNDTSFYFDYLNTEYGAPISDYGLPKLEKIANKLMDTYNPEQQLLLVDQMFNVIHMRNDLCALFLEGGEDSLNILKNQKV